MALQRSGLPLLIVSGIALLVSGAVVWLVADPFGGDPSPEPGTPTHSPTRDLPESEPESQPEADTPDHEADRSEPGVEPTDDLPRGDTPVQVPPVATPPEQSAIIDSSTYVVQPGDSLYSIAGEVWSDPFLWPLILAENDESITDPDFLPRGSRLGIPQWTVVEQPLHQEQRDQLSASHVVAYQHYRALGADAVGLGQGQPRWWLDRLGRTRGNNARWVLYSGLRYNERLLDDFADRIEAQDLRDVRGYIERFGLPPNRR